MNDKLFASLQYLVPQHALSRLAGKVASCHNKTIKSKFIQWFIKRYNVDMSQALNEDPASYACFNDFFTRALKADARSIDTANNSVVCPADGSVSQLGSIVDGRIFQAKGQLYSACELLGGDEALASEFTDGSFATIYLSPKDYHRVHMPLTGRLRQMTVVPGDLFSVNTATAREVPRLFSRNERAVCIFDTDAGPMAVVLVGAMIVAGIETVWAGEVAPFKRRITTTHYNANLSNPITLEKGAEMGRFKLGSTAIVLFGKNKVKWGDNFSAETATQMGEAMGQVID